MAEEIIGIKITTDAAQATQEVKKLDTAFEATDQSVKSLRTQMREAAANVQLMADKFGATSKEAVNAAKKAADLKDRIGDAKALTDAFNPDAKFKAVASSLAGVAGGFSALQGAMALFGNENKDVEKALLKVNAAMALSQGLQAVGESVDSFKQLGAVIKSSTTFQNLNNAATSTATAIQKAFGIATVQTSVGFNILKGAIIATGIGALVVALGLVIANFDKISNWIKSSPLGALAKGVGELFDKFTDFVGITSEAERSLNRLTASSKIRNEQIERDIKLLSAQGGKEEEIYKKKSEMINNDLEILKKKTDAKGVLYGEDAKKFKDLNNERLVLTAEYNKKSAEEDKKAAEEAKKKRDEANKQSIEDKKTADKMLLDLQKSNTLSVIEDETQKAIKLLEIDSKAKADEINQLKVSQSVKDELIRLNNQKLEADKAVIEKKAKEDLDKKQSEEQTNLNAFNQKISEIRNAAIVDDNKKAEADRLAKLRKQIQELDEDKNFLKLSLTEQAQIKQDLIFASEAEFNKQRAEKSKAAFDEQIELERNSLKGLSNIYGEYYQILRELENQQYKNDILNAQGNADKILAIEKKHSKSILDIQIAEFNAKKDLQLQYVGIVGSVGGLLKQIAGKNKALAITALLLEKAAAIATIVVQTAKSLGAATLAAAPMLANPFTAIPGAILLAKSLAMAKISAGISIAGIVLGAAQGISAINQAAPGGDGASSSGGGSSLPDLGGASPMGSGGALPVTDDVAPDTGSVGGGGGQVRASGDTIVRAYVVESDITNTQGRMQEIENRARFE